MRLGYRVAAVLAVAGFAVWFGLPFGGDLGQRFDAGAPTEVRLEANRPYMIWTTDATAPACEAVGVEFVDESDPGVDLEAEGAVWRGERLIRATTAGVHRVTCDRAGAIGDPPWGYSGRARALTWATALGLLLAGAAVAVLTARREPSGPSPAAGPAGPRTPRSGPAPPPN